MTLPKTKTYINCESCGKQIELKCGRTLCIKCLNQKDKARQRSYRDNPEYRQKYNEKNKERYYLSKNVLQN